MIVDRTLFSRPYFSEFIDAEGQTWTVLLLRNFDALYDQVLDTSRSWAEVATPSYGLLGDISFLVRALFFALTPVRKRTWRLIACPIPRGLIGSMQQACLIERFDTEEQAMARTPSLIAWLKSGAGHEFPRFAVLRYPQ